MTQTTKVGAVRVCPCSMEANYFKRSFLNYLRGRKRRWDFLFIATLPQILAVSGAGLGWGQELGTQSGPPVWLAGTARLKPSLAASQAVHQQEAGTGNGGHTRTRHSKVGCSSYNWQLNRQVKLKPFLSEKNFRSSPSKFYMPYITFSHFYCKTKVWPFAYVISQCQKEIFYLSHAFSSK